MSCPTCGGEILSKFKGFGCNDGIEFCCDDCAIFYNMMDATRALKFCTEKEQTAYFKTIGKMVANKTIKFNVETLPCNVCGELPEPFVGFTCHKQ